jgi:predicted ATPase
MYIHKLTVRNFLIHRQTSIELSPITVLIGPNGGGKSALFDAILNFSMLARGSIRTAFGSYPYSYTATKYRGTLSFGRIGFDVVMSRNQQDEERLHYTINYSQQGVAEAGSPNFMIFTESLRAAEGTLLFDRDNPDNSPLRNALQYVGDDIGILAAVRKAEIDGRTDGLTMVSELAKEIGRFNRFRLSPHELSRPSRAPVIEDAGQTPRLGYEGEDLASCLYYMNENKDPALERIIAELKVVLPEFEGFEFNMVGVEKVAFSMRFSDGRGTVNSARMSHGNLLFLGLMVLTHASNRPPVMLLEEPENGLTPQAIERFYCAVRSLATREDVTQRSQILISSHSPFVICDAWNGEDRDFIHQVKIENGQGIVRRLSAVVAENAGPLGKDKSGARTVLSLRNAAELMSGYLQ